MTKNEVIERLKKIPNGANIGITYRSDISKQLSKAGRDAGHKIEKEGRVVLAKGMRKDRDPENIPGDRSWGKHTSDEDEMTNGQSFVIEHNGKYYVDFEVGSAGGRGISAPKFKYFLDGAEVAKEDLEPLMQPAAYKRMNTPHTHYSINIDNIIDIRYKGRTAESLSEDLDKVTGGEFFDDELVSGDVDIEECFNEECNDDEFFESVKRRVRNKKSINEAKVRRELKAQKALNENFEAQKYGYRNATEMRNANKINK